MAKVSSSKDLLLLLLYARGHKNRVCEPVRGRTRLMKMIFLFDKEVRRRFNLEKAVPKDCLPDFSPYDFGPFSAKVFSDLEFLVELGFVDVRRTSDSATLEEEALEYEYWQAGSDAEVDDTAQPEEEEFALSRIGRQFVEEGEAGELTPEQWRGLDEFKRRCTGTDLRTLLRYVYTKYPEMTTESKIRDELLRETPG